MFGLPAKLTLITLILLCAMLTITCASSEVSAPQPSPTPMPTTIPPPTPTPTTSPLHTPTISPLERELKLRKRLEEAAAQARAGRTPTPTPTSVPTPTPRPPQAPLSMDSEMLMTLVRQVRPAVVRVNYAGGVGSGIIFETDGRNAYILTNEHVVGTGRGITITVNDRKGYSGTVLGKDTRRDLAVVRICCGSFATVPFGRDEDIEAGRQIVNIGYALGLEGEASVTTGIISAYRYDRIKDTWDVQSDAATNPGNSGGPMLSTDGVVLGINTYKIDSSQQGRDAEGLGFAVSVRTILSHIETLRGSPFNPSATSTPTPSSPRAVPAQPTPTARSVPTATPMPTPTPRPRQLTVAGPYQGVLKVREYNELPIGLYNQPIEGDVIVEATFYNPTDLDVGSYTTTYGLVFRHSEETFFVFQIWTDIYTDRDDASDWELYRHDLGWGNGRKIAGSAHGTPLPFIDRSRGGTNHLRVEVVDDQIVKLSINGIAVHDAASLPYPQDQYYDISDWPSTGKVGLVTAYDGYYEGSRSVGWHVYYANFGVTYYQ